MEPVLGRGSVFCTSRREADSVGRQPCCTKPGMIEGREVNLKTYGSPLIRLAYDQLVF
jgi:hypothetical protein